MIVPRKGYAYRLDNNALTTCKEAILTQAGEKAVFRDGKLYLNNVEKIGDNAFRDSNIESIYFGNKLKEIGNENGVVVDVFKDELLNTEIAKITEIVVSQTNLGADKIKITTNN